jgi:exodeoxyribonuclease V gamma subunit
MVAQKLIHLFHALYVIFFFYNSSPGHPTWLCHWPVKVHPAYRPSYTCPVCRVDFYSFSLQEKQFLYLYQSNRLEILCNALYRVLDSPLSDPLTAETIVVQNPGMARWLSQHIAVETGIAANLNFPLPATFIWNIFSHTLGELPDLSSFNREILLWRILAELNELLTNPSMEAIAAYLRNDENGGKKFQLAGKIADLFDQYLVYRPELLLSWQQGADMHWQAVLWRKLTEHDVMHRATLFQRFNEAEKEGTLMSKKLPKRVCLFGINSLAPVYLEVISRISDLTEIHIFHLSPCAQAWDDILPERLLAMKRHSWRRQGQDDISNYFTSGNPLLASTGSMGQEFFSLLMELNPVEIDLYEAPEPTSLLAMIQGDILELHDRSKGAPQPLETTDNSIRFHCCHSPMREIQVLHDRLLDLFAADPDLKPADILVMAPDINQYAPIVTGVFGSAQDNLHIPWSIADRSYQTDQPVIDAFTGLLELASSRFTAPEVVALLQNRTILTKFNLQEEDIPALRASIFETGIRWGLDMKQRRQQGMDESELYTWAFGLDRLLLGYMTGTLEFPFQGIMPAGSIPEESAPWLGSLAAFIDALQKLQHKLQTDHTPSSWSKILLWMLEHFLDGSHNRCDQDGLRMLREKITRFADNCEQADFQVPVSLAIIHSHFSKQLAEPAGGQAFLSGKVTFCNMVPMRSVPFKIIWLLGMNDMDYPRSQRPPAFDLIAASPRLGDRSRRDDDRYLFLEALLSARNQLSISWLGRDQQSNADQPPSVVVAELRDYINRGWQSPPLGNCSDQLTVEYPLQAFSRHCFNGDSNTTTYAKVWLPAGEEAPDPTFIRQPLPEADVQQHIETSQLIHFWNHPVRYFLEQSIGLRLRMEDEILAESETFCLDNLQKYQLGQKLITRLLAGEDPETSFLQLQAAGELPAGQFGRMVYNERLKTAHSLTLELKPLMQGPVDPVEINLSLDEFRITGWLNSLFTIGRISYRTATCKPEDLLQLWIHHLLLHLTRPPETEPVSIHVATDTIICFKNIDDPATELERLLRYYRQGLGEPLHFYPKTSYAWAKANSDVAARNAARRAWYSGYYNGEEDDPAYTIALRGQYPLDETFENLAALFIPILGYMEEYHATA